MRVVVAVNRIDEIGYRQTTALIVASLVRAGFEVHLASVEDFSLVGTVKANGYFVKSLPLSVTQNELVTFDSLAVQSLAKDSIVRRAMEIHPKADLLLIRTNPGRDRGRIAVHDLFIDFCYSARLAGLCVLNAPSALRFFASKAALSVLAPEYRPEMVVSHDAEIIKDFVLQANVDCVVKPVIGSRGQGVVLARSDSDLDAICGGFDGQAMVAQHFVHSDEPGDKRVIVLDGEILSVNGVPGGIQRKPSDGDFRANIHAGGSAHPLRLTDEERDVITCAAKYLQRHGIWLAGIDLIANKIIEFNVHSTGGLYYANQFSGVDFSELIVDRLIEHRTSGCAIGK